MMRAINQVEHRAGNGYPGFGLMEEIRQLKGLRKVRLKVYGPGDQEIDHLDEMIHERLLKLMA